MSEHDQPGPTPSTSQDDLQGEKADKRPLDRRCQGMKDDGTACGAWTVQGEKLCAGHLGLGVAAGGDVARAAQLQGAEVRSTEHKRRKQSTKERLEALVEDLQDELAEAFRAGLAGKDGAVDRVRVAEMLLSRVHGKPKETMQVEVEMPEDLTLLRQMSWQELAVLYRRVAPDGALAQLLPATDDTVVVVGYTDEPLQDV